MRETSCAFDTEVLTGINFNNAMNNDVHMDDILQQIPEIAKTNANVLIYGENGTEKEGIARSIHENSNRANGPFVMVDCVLSSGDLLEKELFGYEKGAFTGTNHSKPGLLELAYKGTLYLNEISELSPELQEKLYQALQQRQVYRFGGSEGIKINIRIISAIEQNPFSIVNDDALRLNLYYLLGAIPINIPPLRQRKDDIQQLSESFIRDASKASNKPFVRLSTDALTLLRNYSWPGNISELKSVIENVISQIDGSCIHVSDLSNFIHINSENSIDKKEQVITETPASSGSYSLPLKQARQQWVEKFERKYLINLLNRYNGNISKVARKAEVHRMTIYRMLKNYDISIAPRRAL